MSSHMCTFWNLFISTPQGNANFPAAAHVVDLMTTESFLDLLNLSFTGCSAIITHPPKTNVTFAKQQQCQNVMATAVQEKVSELRSIQWT